MKINPSTPSAQRGAVALLVSIILLIAATLMVFLVARGAVTEQQLSANEARNRAAIAAANAGLDRAIADLQAKTIPPATGLAVQLPNASAHFRVWVCHPGTLPAPASGDLPPCPATSTNSTPAGCDSPVVSGVIVPLPVVYSCGWSDDSAARHLVIQSVAQTVPLSGAPTNPLTAIGNVNVSGSATVVNTYNNLTIWSGTSVSSLGNAGKAFVRDPGTPAPSVGDDGRLTAPGAPPTSCQNSDGYVCTTEKTNIGPDVVANDPNLGYLNYDSIFNMLFGTSPDVFRESFVSYETTGAEIGSIIGKQAETIWVDAQDSPTTTINGDIGTRENPVILVIDGNVSSNMNVTVYGLVVITGNLEIAGNMNVQGALLVNGNVSGTGSLTVMYDPETLNPRDNQLGKPTSHPGSWRDWVAGS